MFKVGSRSRAVFLRLALLAAGARAQGASPVPETEARTAHYLETVRDKPVALAIFLRELPKGADLHNHLAGAVYAESMIKWGAEGGLCVRLANLTLTWPPCDPDHGRPLLSQALAESPTVSHDLIDAFSMRDFRPQTGLSGHDQFFRSFDHFGPALAGHTPRMIAEAANRAAADRVDYLELMDSPGMAAARSVAGAASWRNDPDGLYAQFAPVLTSLVDRTKSEIAANDLKARQIMHCDTADAEAGCRVQIRYIAQVIRNFPPADVFAQIQFGYALAAADPMVVGVNLVGPEDDPITLRDYATQMVTLAWCVPIGCLFFGPHPISPPRAWATRRRACWRRRRQTIAPPSFPPSSPRWRPPTGSAAPSSSSWPITGIAMARPRPSPGLRRPP